VYANLRPVRSYKSLLDSSPLKNHLVDGTDMIIVRELTGGMYYGTPRGIFRLRPEERAINTMVYTRAEIERVRANGFPFGAWPKKEADVSRQVERARKFAALAQGGR